MTRPNLQVVVDNEGQVHDGCPRCEDVAVEDVAHLEAEVRRLRRKIDRLEADKQREREEDPSRRVILDLIDHWRLVTGHLKSNAHAGDRFDILKARIKEGFTPEQIRLAISGLGAYPYEQYGRRYATPAEGRTRRDQLSALKKGERLEQLAVLGYKATKQGGTQ